MVSKAYTATEDLSLIISIAAVTGNDKATVLYVAPSIAITVSGIENTLTELHSIESGGYNTNLRCSGISRHKIYFSKIKSGNTITIIINPFEPKFQNGYDIVLLRCWGQKSL